jgi:ABC-type maltose transport system permease subunit
MQTKKQSLIESFTNVAIGYIISLLSLFIIFPILGIESSTGKNILITLYFTIISVFRSYIIRRYFNKKLK